MDSEALQQMAESCTAMMDGMTQMMEMQDLMPMDQGQGAMGTMAVMGGMIDAAIPLAGGWWLALSVGLLLAVVGAAVLFVRRRSPAEPASIVLGRRYARGELGREEYLSMRNDLMEGRGSQPDGGRRTRRPADTTASS